MSMTLHWRSYLVRKDGHAPDECEDAVGGDPAAGRFAVADGASESYAAGDWARLLVKAFVTNGPSRDWLNAPRAEWRQAVDGAAVSWYAEEKSSAGGHATFLGLTLRKGDGLFSWEAAAVGDACLFHLVAGACLSSFPVDSPSGFTASPALVGSRAGVPQWQVTRGVLRPGEALLLATDALSQCLLASAGRGSFLGAGLMHMEPDAFAHWVKVTRSTGRLRNDDVALGVVEVAVAEPPVRRP